MNRIRGARTAKIGSPIPCAVACCDYRKPKTRAAAGNNRITACEPHQRLRKQG